ncbi:MAG: hypothetical protein ABI747_02580 [Candidatus Moraniibacteriota bacterium]
MNTQSQGSLLLAPLGISEPVQVILVRAICTDCPSGTVIENMAIYGTDVLPALSLGDEPDPETQASVRERLEAVCESRGCPPGRCTFNGFQSDVPLNELLTRIYTGLRISFDKGRARELFESFTREGFVISELQNAIDAVGLTACLEEASDLLGGLREWDLHPL